MKIWKFAATGVAVLIMLVGLGLAVCPFIYAELFMLGSGEPLIPAPLVADGAMPGVPVGTVVDDYWRVQKIAPDTWAIGEPRNAPDNYEYLLIGKTRALLIDAGSSTTRDIRPVVARLTQLPVTVIPTHLHFDHTNGLKYLTSIALIDLPETRARVHDGEFLMQRYDYMDSRGRMPVFRVTEWVKPGDEIDLGGRHVRVLWTPGHTASSSSIYDEAAKLLFTGDFSYTTTLYAFLPDSSLSAYEATANQLLATIPADTTIYGAHCCRNDAPPAAPWLDVNDLRDVRQAVQNIRNGSANGQRGFIIRRFPTNRRMTIVTLYPFGNR